MLKIEGISKRFGGREALAPLHLEVARGEIFGLLGHNGAGKSTTFGILLGHVRPDAGDVTVGGVSALTDRARALAKVGAIFEAPAFYDYLSGWKNLEILVALSAVPDRGRMREAVELVGLAERIGDPVRHYSHGMRQRLALAQALLPEPDLVILDEPADGLDPEGIQEMRRTILRLRDERGMTVIFSSHLLSEAEQICDRVGILRAGQLVFCGKWDESNRVRVRLACDNFSRALEIAGAFGGAAASGELIVFPAEADLPAVLAALVAGGVRVSEFARHKVSLEDFYMERAAG